MANTHISKLSYIGDQLNFEFPSSEESLVLDKGENERMNQSVIERAGSIFIKSGIGKVTPFSADTEDLPELQHRYKITPSGTDNVPKVFERNDSIIEDIDSDDDIDMPEVKEIKNGTEIHTIDEEEEAEGIEQSRNETDGKTRSNTEESHYESQQAFSPQTSLLQKRMSLRHANSTGSFVNPYLRNSLLRKHQKEVANDIDLSKRVQSMKRAFSPEVADLDEEEEEEDEVEINKDELQIPRRSSKRLPRLQSLNRWASLSRNSTMVSRERKLNRSDTKRSVNTLANDLRKYRHSFKSVDLSGLDQILVELLNVKDGSATNSRINSTTSKSSFRSVRQNTAEDVSREASVKPFNVGKSISRNRSLKRSISVAASEARTASEKSNVSKRSFNSRGTGLPSVKEDELTTNTTCELKRSNAVKRKPILIEFLIRILKVFKDAGKKCWRLIKSPTKKNVTFQRKKAGGSLRKKSVKIGEPVLVDIKDTPFNSHVINMGEVPSTQASPVGATAPFVESNNNVSGDSVETAIPAKERLSTIASVGEDETSRLLSVENETSKAEHDQLEDLWKQYLSTTIRNRIDMKVDVSKLDYIERVKSVQSDRSRRDSMDQSGNFQVEKIMEKYIVSAESSRTSTMSQGVSSYAGSMVTAAELLSSSGSSSRERTSTGSWSTIGSDESGSATASVSSISTIEEESSDFDDQRTNRSSVSTMEDVDDVYDEYSMLSDDDEEEQEVGVEGAPSVVLRGKASATSLKQSDRIMNLQSILTKGASTLTKSHLERAGSTLVSRESGSCSVNSNSVYSESDRSDAFSFSRSISSVCRV